MSENKIDKIFKTLINFFKDDSDSLELINILKEKADCFDKNKDHAKSKTSSSFPLPPEASTTKATQAFFIFSDGACRGNPGPGSWASMAQDKDGLVLFEASEVDFNTTNNRMELSGVINGLKRIESHLKENNIPFDQQQMHFYFYSDSKYVITGIKEWMPEWKKLGWKRKNNKAIENLNLWQELDLVFSPYLKNCHFLWVQGHSGHPQNEHCDRLCNIALDEVC